MGTSETKMSMLSYVRNRTEPLRHHDICAVLSHLQCLSLKMECHRFKLARQMAEDKGKVKTKVVHLSSDVLKGNFRQSMK